MPDLPEGTPDDPLDHGKPVIPDYVHPKDVSDLGSIPLVAAMIVRAARDCIIRAPDEITAPWMDLDADHPQVQELAIMAWKHIRRSSTGNRQRMNSDALRFLYERVLVVCAETYEQSWTPTEWEMRMAPTPD